MRNSERYGYDRVGKIKRKKKGGSSEKAQGKKKVWLETKLDTTIAAPVLKAATGLIGRIHPNWASLYQGELVS